MGRTTAVLFPRDTTADKGKLFLQFQPLAYKLAHRFAHRYGLPQTDMEDEALELLGEICAQWTEQNGGFNPTKSKPISWVYNKLFWRLADYCRRRPREIHFSDISAGGLMHRANWLATFCRDLGEDARLLVTTIFNAPNEIAEDVVCYTYQALAAAGWQRVRILRCWQEVGAALATQ